MNLILGDCIEKLKELPDNSVDGCVTDPPYGLEFMGKEWDRLSGGFSDGKFKGFVLPQMSGGNRNVKCPDCGKWIYDHYPRNCRCGGVERLKAREQNAWHYQWAKELFRVLKPGAHLLSFGGSRTYHRMACAIEDAGFEIRDMIEWVYGSGFPKSLNIGKAVDKIQGNERKITGSYKVPDIKGDAYGTMNEKQGGSYKNIEVNITKGTSEWEGWGTALKPAHEPICMARKPLEEKTVAENCLKWGTGGLDIDGCRVEADIQNDPNYRPNAKNHKGHGSSFSIQGDGNRSKDDLPDEGFHNSLGRFPANLILSYPQNEYILKDNISESDKRKVCMWLQKNL